MIKNQTWQVLKTCQVYYRPAHKTGAGRQPAPRFGGIHTGEDHHQSG